MFWQEFARYSEPDTAPEDGAYEHPDQEEEEEEKAAVGEEINVMLLSLLPWGISILFHVGLIILAIFVVWTTSRVEKEEVIIPIARLSPTPGAPLTMKVTKKVNVTRKTRRTITKNVIKPPTQFTSQVKTDLALTGVAGGSPAKASPFDTAVRGGIRATMYGTGGATRGGWRTSSTRRGHSSIRCLS